MYKYSSYIVVGRDSDGRYIRKKVSANSLAEFERKKFQVRGEYEKIKNPSDITFKKYADKWLKAYKSSREKATIAMYENALKKTSSIDYVPLKNIRKTDLQTIISDNADSPSVCRQISLLFRQIWGCAIEDGILSTDITKRLDLPILTHKKGRALKPEEITAVSKANLKPMDRMYVQLLYYFGLRPQEAIALMPKDFDFDKKVVTISRAIGFDKHLPYVKKSKTRTIRSIPIPDEFIPILKQYLKQNKSLYLIHRDNNPITKSSLAKMWLRIKKEINKQLGGNNMLDLTDGLVSYTFRHNFCTECYYRGLTVLKTSELMGNSPEMVMKVYAHLDNSKESILALSNLSMTLEAVQ